MNLRRVLLLAACAPLALSCGSGSSVKPTPTFEDPVVSCPADISLIAHNGQEPTASFDLPMALKGSPPVVVACTPPSGSPFPNGITTVTCEATDSRGHKGSCSFSVVVTPVPQLLKTTFMAFGDSVTEGKSGGIVIVPPNIFNTSISYVERLSTKLDTRYADQRVTVIAEGKGDEEAGQGKLRLPLALASYNPDALLLLEGVNDLLHTTDPAKLPAAIDSLVNALRTMVVTARGRGVKVYLATLTPLSPTRQQSQAAVIPTVNAMIKTMAAQENAILVDMNAAIPLELVGADGIHLKPEGYDVMADTWMQAIQSTLEVSPPTP